MTPSFVGRNQLVTSGTLYVVSYDFDRCWMHLKAQGNGLPFNDMASWRMDEAMLHVPGFQLGGFAGRQRFKVTVEEVPRDGQVR
jgi:hypothetical protein